MVVEPGGARGIPALTAAYMWAIRRFPTPPWRVACFAAAIVLLLAVTITPIETIALNYLLSVHLIQNVVLAEWAPLLAVLGIPPALAALAPRVPPVPALAALGRQLRRLAPAVAVRRGAPPSASPAPPRARALFRHRRAALVAGRAGR